MKKQILDVEQLIIGNENGQHVKLTPNGLSLWNQEAKQAVLGADPAGSACFHLFDKNGTAQLSLELEEGTAPTVAVRDRNGTERLSLCMIGGIPWLQFRNGAGTVRMEATLKEEEDDPRILFCDRDGSPVHELTMNFHGELRVHTCEEMGERHTTVLARKNKD